MSENNNIDLKCPYCGALRHIDSNYEFIICDYCGASEPYRESEKVKIERMRSQTERQIAADKAQVQKETELKKAEINNVSQSIMGGLEILNKGDEIISKTRSVMRTIFAGIFMIGLIIFLIIALVIGRHFF